MFKYQIEEVKSLIGEVLRNNLPAETFTWLEEQLGAAHSVSGVNALFARIPRKTGKAIITIHPEQAERLGLLRNGFSIEGWTADRLCRVSLLISVDASDKDKYFRIIDGLFLAAEMNELIALYSSLALLAHPEIWVKRCAEGIRSNIATVLEAIMYANPYPAENLDQQAWNQLVLKAFFTDKDIHRIIGIDARANAELAYTLSDFAHERWAAGRTFDPQLWRLVGSFIDARLLPDIKKVLQNGAPREKQAAVLALCRSDYEPAMALIEEYPQLKEEIESNVLTWEALALS